MGRRLRIKRRRTMIMIRRSKNKYFDLFINIWRFSFLVLTLMKAMKGNKANYKYVLFNLKREFLYQFYFLDLTGVRFKLNSKCMIAIPNMGRYIFINYQNQMLMLISFSSSSFFLHFLQFLFHSIFLSFRYSPLVKAFSSFCFIFSNIYFFLFSFLSFILPNLLPLILHFCCFSSFFYSSLFHKCLSSFSLDLLEPPFIFSFSMLTTSSSQQFLLLLRHFLWLLLLHHYFFFFLTTTTSSPPPFLLLLLLHYYFLLPILFFSSVLLIIFPSFFSHIFSSCFFVFLSFTIFLLFQLLSFNSI